MLTAYLQAAMRRAKYEILEDDGTFFGSIPDCQGVWANAPTLEECRDELQSVLEGWVMLGLGFQDPLPEIDGIRLEVPKIRKAA